MKIKCCHRNNFLWSKLHLQILYKILCEQKQQFQKEIYSVVEKYIVENTKVLKFFWQVIGN